MNRNSIRWRLPASYAVIALLAALSLGSMMLLVLRNYYARQESEYLFGNATALQPILAQLMQSGLPEGSLQDRIVGLAFLSQTRIRLLDTHGNTIADSGLPTSNQVVEVLGAPIPETTEFSAPVDPVIGQSRVLIYSPAEDIPPQDIPLEKQIPPGKAADIVLPVSASPYGYGFVAKTELDLDPVHRSSQSVSVLLMAADGHKLGVLEFSNGPSYGAEVIDSVTTAWLIASVFAVVVAALTGWLMSRRVTRPVLALETATRQMADGDLRVRVDLRGERQQEFLSLAHSFNGMAEQMEQTVSTLRRFVADAAHELNTPLTALQTNVELALAADDSTRGEWLTRAQSQIERLKSLVTGLLNLSRLEGQNSERLREAVDLVALARAVSETYASRAEQAGLNFRLEVSAVPLITPGDAAQLRRALENLLDNAIKFTPSGGEVRLRLTRADGQILLIVEDTGIGIPPEDRPLLFKRFHRGRNAASYPGNGLGLAIVQVIVEAHGGAVTMAATAGGTCFTVVLPSHPDR
jgi:signal transduction histidine kinase